MTTKTRTATRTKLIEFVNQDYRIKLGQDGANLLAGGDTNTKLAKNGDDYLTKGLSMSPSRLAWSTIDSDDQHWSGELIVNPDDHLGHGFTAINNCAGSSTGCVGGCIDHQGMGGVWPSIGLARRARTVAFYTWRQWFIDRLDHELTNAELLAAKQDKTVACRLDVFQDLKGHWLQSGLIDRHPTIQFYDYSKLAKFAGAMRPNYWVTFSRSEDNHELCLEMLNRGINVALVVADSKRPYVANQSARQFARGWNKETRKPIAPWYHFPRTIEGHEWISGEEHDLRFLDTRGRKRGRWVVLKAKAGSYEERAKLIDSGFAYLI